MTDIPTWTTRSPERGYDHPLDRMDNLAGMAPVEPAPLFTEEQGYKAVERLFLPSKYSDDAVEAMARVAMNCLTESDNWETMNLGSMALVSGNNDKILDEYTRFAGNPRNVAGFINWFADTSHVLPARPYESHIVGHEGHIRKGELITDEESGETTLKRLRPAINGYTLTTGIANQIPGYSLTHPLDVASSKALRDIVKPQYGFEVDVFKSAKTPRRHRIELVDLGNQGWQTDNGEVILHITRERGAVNYTRKRDAEHEPQVLYDIKRFDSLVAISGIQLVREIIDILASDNGTIVDDKRTPELSGLMQRFEAIIRQQGKARPQNAVRVVPLLTSRFIRDPKK